MINITDVLTRLTAQTPYLVDIARHVQPSLEYNGTPIVYVGYQSIKSSILNKDIDYNEYNINGEGLVQVIETHTVCTVDEFYDTWHVVYAALNGWNPVGAEQFRTALCYTEGGILGLDNGIQRHIDRWRIGFSTVINDF